MIQTYADDNHTDSGGTVMCSHGTEDLLRWLYIKITT
jgi:hypothetical protein